MSKRLPADFRRSLRVQVRLRRSDARVIAAIAHAQRVSRSEWLRQTIAAAVARLMSPQNEGAEPSQARRPEHPDGDFGDRQRVATT